MDPTILKNTQKYARAVIATAVENAPCATYIDTKVIYVPKPVANPGGQRTWDAALVDGLTQSRKTWKAFDLIVERTEPDSKTLVLFITQANSVTAANQIVSRSRQDERINKLFKTIGRISKMDLIFTGINNGNYMLVDFWNSRNMDLMLETVKECAWDHIYIVIDEAEQGGRQGLATRLSFIRDIEKLCMCPVRIILITATVANLSKSIMEIAHNQKASFSNSVVHKIVHTACVEHHYVIPNDTYVGPSWYVENKDNLRLIKLPRKKMGMDKEDVEAARNEIVNAELDRLTAAQKELVLIVTSTQKDAHRAMASHMFVLGFNVVVELNSDNNKNYNVFYRGMGGTTKKWQIPYSEIEFLAARGMLKKYQCDDGLQCTGINGVEDITMPHILQAALFMNTAAQARIVHNVHDAEELIRLRAIAGEVCSRMGKDKVRPDDWPREPKVALIAGHIAGRGNTFQNPFIDLACTAFCFTGKSDKAQRGATNAQKLGRACGLLSDIYVTQNRRPIMIATKHVIEDALTNELVLKAKADKLKEGELISLQELVSKADWDRTLKVAMTKVARDKLNSPMSKEGAIQLILQKLASSKNGEASLSWAELNKVNTQLHDMLRKQNKRLVNEMMHDGLVEQADKRSLWRITEKGRRHLVQS